MTLRRKHLVAIVVAALAISLGAWGHLRVAFVMLGSVVIALIASAEIFRVRTDPPARKDDR